jgi:RNA polymerase sigma-54 factor
MVAIGPRLDLRTTQTLVLSPQLQAAIRLLALSNMELAAEIASEMEKNPLLEAADDFGRDEGGAEESARDEGGADPAGHASDNWDVGPGGGEEQAPDVSLVDPGDPVAASEVLADAGSGAEATLDIDLVEERFHHDSVADTPRGGDGDEEFSLDQLAAEGVSLAAHLTAQAEARLTGQSLAIALAIIAVIDEAGYVTEPLPELAERLGIELGDAEAVLRVIQGFEPTGVGARSLAECIALQAKERDRYDPCMAALLDHLDLVARGDLVQLRRVCHVDAEDLADMLRELRSYDPKPGLAFGGAPTAPAVPDIFVRRANGGFVVELNSGTLPRLIVNRQYQAQISRHAGAHGDRAERQFLESCLAQAQWLIRALDQRASTILKVATEIVKAQTGFFEMGVSHLKPMTMKSVADAIEVHESTVSRVTSNKYLACERGTFELKYFFSSAVHSADGGEDVSIAAVKARLKALIDGEEAMKPLSDNDLHAILEGEGFQLSRRTVAKYREAMHIPSSFDRRRRALVQAA